jgi:hypothetical protein
MCCGRDKTQLRANAKPLSPNPAIRPAHRPATSANRNPLPAVPFVYAGNTAMTVIGPVSGVQYRFDHPGARVEVDARDRILLASLRQLRQVK